jgi:hypothetical protein
LTAGFYMISLNQILLEVIKVERNILSSTCRHTFRSPLWFKSCLRWFHCERRVHVDQILRDGVRPQIWRRRWRHVIGRGIQCFLTFDLDIHVSVLLLCIAAMISWTNDQWKGNVITQTCLSSLHGEVDSLSQFLVENWLVVLTFTLLTNARSYPLTAAGYWSGWRTRT